MFIRTANRIVMQAIFTAPKKPLQHLFDAPATTPD
jgi:hypothetical protein